VAHAIREAASRHPSIEEAKETGVRLLSRLRLWQKLAILVGALLIPTAVACTFYIRTASEAIGVTRLEIAGGRYLQPLGAVLGEVLNHRGVVHALVSGDATRRAAAVESADKIDRLMGEVGRVDAELDAQFATSAQWRAIVEEWRALKTQTGELTLEENRDRHERLVTRILELNMKVWMDSTLSLDPEGTAYYLIIAATDKTPNVMSHVSSMRMLGTSAALAGTLSPVDAQSIVMHRQLVALDFKTMSYEISSVAGASAEVREAILPALQNMASEFARFDAFLTQHLPVSGPVTASGVEVFDSGAHLSDSLLQFSSTVSGAVMRELEQRLAAQTLSRRMNGAALGVLLGIALVLSVLFTRAMAGAMAHAISVFRSIATGRYDNVIDAHGTDEAGQVLSALDQMQAELLRLKQEEANVAATVGGRIRAALDHATSSMLVTDSQLNVIYVNHMFNAMMRAVENDLRRDLPQFSLETLVGADVGVLYRDAANARNLLGRLAGQHREEVTLGGRTFRIDANPVVGSGGERIGTVLEWTDRTQQAEVERELQEMLKSVLNGDLERRIAVAGKTGFFEGMSRGVNQLVDKMAEMVSQVQHAAAEVYHGAKEIAEGSGNLSQRTEAQSTSLEETASSMEQMTSTVKQNADNAGQANQLAVAAREHAENGGEVVAQAVRAMHDINEASRRIADIIGVIDEIAFQTNLLALNAAVEAARAGEQGRGFAVVATEVRSLAGRSATAAREIKGLIQDSVRKVQDGSLLVTQSGETLDQIVASVKKVSDIVAEIAAASREQSSGIEQVNRAVTQMDQITQQNAALVEQTSTSSREMAEAARRLDQMMARYRLAQGSVSDTARAA
jgi:methyl-accepting chemotaxis protein